MDAKNSDFTSRSFSKPLGVMLGARVLILPIPEHLNCMQSCRIRLATHDSPPYRPHRWGTDQIQFGSAVTTGSSDVTSKAKAPSTMT